LGQTDSIGAKSPIFYLFAPVYSATAVTPSEKSSIITNRKSNKIRKNKQINTAQEDVKCTFLIILVRQKVVGQTYGLTIGSKKWAGSCSPCPIGSAANDFTTFSGGSAGKNVVFKSF